MKSITKNKLQNSDLTLGSWITLSDPNVTEIICQNPKIDWVAIDMEHSMLTLKDVSSHIQVARLMNKTALVRIPNHDGTLIKQVMDAGADGIIVPMINSVSQLESCYRSLHYPPIGVRGVGLSRAQRYGATGGFQDYKKNLTSESILIAQIENIKALEEIDAITSNEFVDAIFIGPYDLSASMGLAGEFDSDQYHQAVRKIKDSALNNKCSLGIHIVEPNPQEVKSSKDQGFNFIAYSTDFRMIENSLSQGLKDLD